MWWSTSEGVTLRKLHVFHFITLIMVNVSQVLCCFIDFFMEQVLPKDFGFVYWRLASAHRYRLEIPEPAPSLSWHGAHIGGIRVFPAIKITVICQVRMYCGLSVKVNTRETPHGAWRSWAHFVCVCLCVCGQQKNRIPPIWAPWLATPLHREVSEFWDLLSISVHQP